MQNNALMYGVGALVVIAAGVGWWMYTTGMPAANNEAAVGSALQAEPQVQNTTLTGLLGMSGSQKCTFESSTANSSSSGTVYIADGKMRGDFMSTANGTAVESHMVVEDNTSYMWSSAMPMGLKMSLASMSAQGDAQGSFDPNAPVDYSCSAWNADASVFTLPAGIEFQDLSAMMQGKF